MLMVTRNAKAANVVKLYSEWSDLSLRFAVFCNVQYCYLSVDSTSTAELY